MIWLLVGAGLLLTLLLVWLLIVTEGSYLGARVVARLYDLYAGRYDAVKGFDRGYEQAFLGRPIAYALGDRPLPLVLDVATGTGRIPHLLLQDPGFQGRVLGLDLSRDMLAVAAGRVDRDDDRVIWIWQNAMNLPFPADRFDLVTCVEALEFMPDPERALAEMVRVLQPGGWLLTTRRRGWQSRFFPGKAWSKEALLARLHDLGLDQLRIQPWQVDYDLVWAHRPGRSTTPLLPESDWAAALLRCPGCGAPLTKGDQLLSCHRCQVCYDVSERLIELAAGRRCNPAQQGQRGRDDGETDHPAGRR